LVSAESGLTGIGVDYVKHKVEGTALRANQLHLAFPDDWPPLRVLGMLPASSCSSR